MKKKERGAAQPRQPGDDAAAESLARAVAVAGVYVCVCVYTCGEGSEGNGACTMRREEGCARRCRVYLYYASNDFEILSFLVGYVNKF